MVINRSSIPEERMKVLYSIALGETLRRGREVFAYLGEDVVTYKLLQDEWNLFLKNYSHGKPLSDDFLIETYNDYGDVEITLSVEVEYSEEHYQDILNRNFEKRIDNEVKRIRAAYTKSEESLVERRKVFHDKVLKEAKQLGIDVKTLFGDSNDYGC